jgi:hypothetical protein
MQRTLALLFALLFSCTFAPGTGAQEGSGQSGKLVGDGLELEWRIVGAETGPRFFADRTWQANGNVTASTVQFVGVMRVSIASGYTTDAWTSAYVSLPMGEGKKEVKWGNSLGGSILSEERTFSLSIDVPPGRAVLVSAGVGKNGGTSDILAVFFQFAPKPVEKKPIASSPYESYWAWVRAYPPRVEANYPGPAGSVAIVRDGVAFVKTLAPGENDEPSSRQLSGYLRWKLPIWIRAGESVPIEFSIDKLRFQQFDNDTRDASTSLELVGIVGTPGRLIADRHETFGRVTKALTDHSSDVLNPLPIKATAPLTMPAYAKELEWKPLPVAMLAGTEPGAKIVYEYVLSMVSDPQPAPTVASDPEDTTRACFGKSEQDRAALVALGRQIFFESTYLWLDYATAWAPRKVWWNWSDFKSKYHIEAVSLAGEGLVKWAMTGRGAAAVVVGAGLAANAVEDGVAGTLRAIDEGFNGKDVKAALATLFDGFAGAWEEIDKLGTREQRQAALEKMGANMLASYNKGAMLAFLDYRKYWDRAGSDMPFDANIAARLYDLHLAERDLGCLPTIRAR